VKISIAGLVVFVVFFVAGCGGGGNGDSPEPLPDSDAGTSVPTSHLVSATAGVGGRVEPDSQTVDDGTIAVFTVSPELGFVIDSVHGCGGFLDATLYTTAPITAACAVSATFTLDANIIQLSPPEVFGALLPGAPAVLRPRVNYLGEDRLEFQLLAGPDQMEIDPGSGLIGWTPSQADAGGIFNVHLQVTAGAATNSVVFAVRVANPTVLKTVTEDLDEGWKRVTVTEADVKLRGLQVILPPDYVGLTEPSPPVLPPGVSLVDPADVPGGGDYSAEDVIRLTEFFRIDPVRAESDYIEIVFPRLALPQDRHVEELVLYVYDRVLHISDSDSTSPVWMPLTYAAEVTADDQVSILTRVTGSLSFIGLLARTEQGTGLLPRPSEPDLRQYTLANPHDSGVTQVPVSCKDDGLNVDRQLCSIKWPGVGENDACPLAGLTNCEARVRISGFSSNRWSTLPADFSVHYVAGWVLDSMLRFEALGLGYFSWVPDGRRDANIEIQIGKLRDRKFANRCLDLGEWSGDSPEVLRLQSHEGCASSEPVDIMATVLAHEYMHHSQDRAGLKMPTFSFQTVLASRHWLYEGTAVWFQDEVYDQVDFYKDFFRQGLRILDEGLSAQHQGGRSSGYRRFSFFKLLQRSGTDEYGCEFENPNENQRTFLAELFNQPSGNGGAWLKQILGDEAFQCNFGDTFGQDRLMANALEFYTHATLQMNSLTLLDHNEPGWEFEPSPVVVVQSGTIGSFRQERLPPLSSKPFLLSDDGAVGFKRELVLAAAPNSKEVLVSIRSSAANGGEIKRHLVVTSDPMVVTLGYGSVQDWVVSFVNDDPALDRAVEFAVSRLESGPQVIIEPLNGENCTSYGVCGADIVFGSNTDYSQAQLEIDWGDGSSLSVVSVEACVASGECQDLGDGRIRVWRAYSDPAAYSALIRYAFGDGVWHDLPVAFSVSKVNPLTLGATPGDSSATLAWQNLGADRHNLCQADEAVGVFDNCAVYSGGALTLNIGGPPWTVSGLTNGNTYHFRLEALFGNERVISEGASVIPQVSGPGSVASRILNDTGITFCGETSLAAGGNNDPCTGLEPWGQDAHYGRDAQAVGGSLSKVGGGSAGFDFTKIANNGDGLSASAPLGNGPNDWACTRDNVTGLIWEVKKNDPNQLRHQGHTYSWYDPDNTNGEPGTPNGGTCIGSDCDTSSFVQAVNSEGLCGASDWRMPTPRELQGIVDHARFGPAIEIGYFPNTPSEIFWSSLSSSSGSRYRWGVSFYDGRVDGWFDSNRERVRLVRTGPGS